MKALLQTLSLLLLLVALNTQCPIPPNCQNFSVTQNICTSCQKNYLLIGNNCINTFASSPVISGLTAPQQSAYTYTFTSNQGITNSPALSVSSISQPASATNIPQFFVPWYTAQQSTNSGSQSNAQGNAQSGTTTIVINSNAASTANYTDYNCKTPDQANSICLECYSFFYFDTIQGKCTPVNPLCKNYTSQNQCTQCYSGYQLNNGNCTLNQIATASQPSSNGQNSQSQNQQGPSNTDNNCANFTNGVCSQCFQSYYYNTTLNKCTLLNQNCKTATPANICTSCYTGYKINPNNGDCTLQSIDIPSTSSALTSTTQASSQSTTTSNQYITINGLIYQISPQGQITGPIYLPLNTANNLPTSTSTTQINSAGNTPNTSSTSPTATAQSIQSTQPQCYTRQVLINNACVDVSSYCSTWSNVDAKCTGCYTGYRLSSGSCIIG